MKIFVATDISVIVQDNRIYANQKHSTILRRYYSAFGSIVLCARFGVADNTTKSFDDITEIVDSFIEVPSLYKMLLGKCNGEIETAMRTCDLVICRCPAISAFKAATVAKEIGKPYLAESMGDPWDAYWNHGFQGKLIAPYMFMKMKAVVKNANYAVYVTTEYLQRRYPCDNKSIAASNVLLEETTERILQKRIERLKDFDRHNVTLMTTAAVDVWYKGQQYVIKSIPELNKAGIRVKYKIVGEGNRSFLESVARETGVSDQIEFLGRLPLSQVFELLDETDIYLQPSLQEGLPRSVIEAMSRGCVCIGARTAGIPELLEADWVVRRKSVKDLFTSIVKYVDTSYDTKVEIAQRNWNESKCYSTNVLDMRRNSYFKEIVDDLCQ